MTRLLPGLLAVLALALLATILPSLDGTARLRAMTAAAVLAYVIGSLYRRAGRYGRDSAALQRRNDALTAQIGAQSNDLRDSAAQLKSVIDSAVDGIIVIDSRGIVESFNPAAERIFGHAASRVIGQNVRILMPSPYHEEHDTYVQRYLATGEAKIIGIGREVVGRRADGSTFPMHLSVGEMRIGNTRKFTGIVHDLSARVALEAQLRSSEARWRSVIQSAVDGIVLIDDRGRIEVVNPAAERLFGYSEQELIGRNVNVLMPAPYREEHDGYIARYLATGERRIIGIGREVSGLRRDGTTFPLRLSVGEVVLDGQRKFTGILHDLTERVAIEQQLREQTALARLGEMAAVIAHEVKNPLAGIRGAMQVIASRLPADSRDGSMVKEIMSRIDALNELMRELLLFARPPSPRTTSVDLAPLLSGTAHLLAQDPALSGLLVEIEGTAPPVPADADLLRIVFQNLLVNSAHAMEGRGRIRVRIATDNGLCRVAVADEGPGIPPEIRDRIFTAFFTTKARGTGLGLPTARRLVEAHKGRLDVECPPSGGTVMTVSLPLGHA